MMQMYSRGLDKFAEVKKRNDIGKLGKGNMGHRTKRILRIE